MATKIQYYQSAPFFLVVWTPIMLGAFFLCEALSCLKGLNIDKVMVEFDCQEVLTALDSIVPDLSEFGSTIGDCLPLENQFHDLSFHWTRRDANKATNSLARVALSYTTHVT